MDASLIASVVACVGAPCAAVRVLWTFIAARFAALESQNAECEKRYREIVERVVTLEAKL